YGNVDRLAVVAIYVRWPSGHIFIERVGAWVVDNDLARTGEFSRGRNPDIAAPDFECTIDFPMGVWSEVAGFRKAQFDRFGCDDDGGIIGGGTARAFLGASSSTAEHGYQQACFVE